MQTYSQWNMFQTGKCQHSMCLDGRKRNNSSISLHATDNRELRTGLNQNILMNSDVWCLPINATYWDWTHTRRVMSMSYFCWDNVNVNDKSFIHHLPGRVVWLTIWNWAEMVCTFSPTFNITSTEQVGQFPVLWLMTRSSLICGWILSSFIWAGHRPWATLLTSVYRHFPLPTMSPTNTIDAVLSLHQIRCQCEHKAISSAWHHIKPYPAPSFSLILPPSHSITFHENQSLS